MPSTEKASISTSVDFSHFQTMLSAIFAIEAAVLCAPHKVYDTCKLS